MTIFILKLLLTPLLIAALTLIGRRWGPAVSGAVAGLPLTSAPVSVFLALEQGTDFAARAATGTLVGLIAVGAFCFAYAFTASRRNWIASALAGIAAFLVSASLLALTPLNLVATFIIVVLFQAIVLRMMPKAIGGANVTALACAKMGPALAHRSRDGIGVSAHRSRAETWPTNNRPGFTISGFRWSPRDLRAPAFRCA